MEISDRITVLRKGRSIQTVETNDVEVSSLIEMMVGKKMDLSLERETIKDKKLMLELKEVTVLDREKKPALSEASFKLFGGEILGVAGVAGSGQKEL